MRLIFYGIVCNTKLLGGRITIMLAKPGYLVLLLGIILLAISFFATSGLNFTVWAIIFFISMGLCTVGMIMLIVDLIKQMRNKA